MASWLAMTGWRAAGGASRPPNTAPTSTASGAFRSSTTCGCSRSFRKAFAGFDFTVVAGYGERDVKRLLDDASIVRHRGKIEAVINNAGRAVEMVSEGASEINLTIVVDGAAADNAVRALHDEFFSEE